MTGKKKLPKKHRLRRRLLFALFFLVFLIASTHLLVNTYQKELTDFVIERIEKKSNGLYSITYKTVALDLLKRNISLHHLTITPHPNNDIKTKTLINTSMKQLHLQGISYWDMIVNNSLHADNLAVTDGKLTLRHANPKENTPPTLLDISHLSMELERVKVSLNKRFMSFHTGTGKLKDLTYYPKDGFYHLKASSLNFSNPSGLIHLTGLDLVPTYKKYRFSRLKGFQVDRFTLKIGSLSIHDLDTDGLLNKSRLHAGRLEIDSPELEIFRNKRIAKRKKKIENTYPLHLLQKIKFDVAINQLLIRGGTLHHTIHPAGASRTGTIYVNHIDARVENVSNSVTLLEKPSTMTVNAKGKIMGRGDLNINLAIPLTLIPREFSFSGSLGKMDLRRLNNFLATSHIRIDRGVLDNLRFSLKGGNYSARGEMYARYHDLEVALLKKEAERKRRWFASWVTNRILKERNPKPGKPLRVGRIYYKKKTPLPFLAYTWQSLLTGIKSSLGFSKAKK